MYSWMTGVRPSGGSLGLISCTKSKSDRRCTAREMYWRSALFRFAFRYASSRYQRVGILSAKYGFLLPDDVIEPYEMTLKTMRVNERKSWAERVLEQMADRMDLDGIASIYFHAGQEYRSYLIPLVEAMGKKCFVPLEGLGIGRQLAWYKANLR